MLNSCIENLKELKRLIVLLDDEYYQYKSKTLSDASIGQHIRHILEFYVCLINGIRDGVVNYDKRERNLALETTPDKAVYTIDDITSYISLINKDEDIKLVGNFSSKGNITTTIKSSLNRELAYCLEHSIHHQALIKIGLQELNITLLIDDTFGVAPATIRHKQKQLINEHK